MSPITILSTIVIYFALLLTISHFASRRATNATFFTGNRRTPWPLVAIAMIGAVMSGVTFISVPGMIVTKGYSYLQMVIGFIVGYFIISTVLLPLFYRRNLVSIYSYLDQRFGLRSYKAGATMFFISEILGASVRFFVVCAVMQILVCEPLGIPFIVNVAVAISLIWLYTARGGVKSLIWTDILKTLCLLTSVGLSIWFIAKNMNISACELPSVIADDESFRVFYFDDPSSPLYFWKQFIAGVFMVIVMNGLNQDMMQRHMSCPDPRSSRKNMMISGILQGVVITMFLVLGTLLARYAVHSGIGIPDKTDDLFGLVACNSSMPVIVGILFVIGLISAAYSAAGSAVTSLTTSFTLDILDGQRRCGGDEDRLARLRKKVHVLMALLMATVIVIFYYISSDDAISAVYTLASYTYGPILGLFAFGLLTRRGVADRMVPYICLASPLLAWLVQWSLQRYAGYTVGFELLLINGLITFSALSLTSIPATYVEESA